jgi:DNA-binding SARP family transcriptional activator
MNDGADPAAILAHPKRLALLAYLAAGRPYGFHQRDELVALLWPGLDQEHARGALRQTLYRLRQSVGKGVIVTHGDEAMGLDATTVWCDVRAFDEALGQNRPEDALSLYRGDLLPGVFDAGAPEFERWLDSERRELRLRANRAAWLASEQAELAGDTARCAEWAQRGVRLALDDEPGARRLIVLLERLGDRARAIRACDELERYLRTELEVAPSADTVALFARIRGDGAAAASKRGAPPPAQDPRPMAAEENDRVRSADKLTPPNAPASGPELTLASVDGLAPASDHHPATDQRARSRRTRFAALAAVAAILVVGVIAYSAKDRAHLPRVAVIPLENRTANAALDPVGMMAADWIERGLLNPGVLDVVPAATVQTVIGVLASRAGAVTARAPDLKRISKETGAGLLVSGAYYTTGDRIRFELVLNDVVNDRILVSFAPVSVALGDPTLAIDTLRKRVVAAVQQATNVKFHDHMGPGSLPPSPEAYQLYIQASDEWRLGDIDSTERILRQALALEPNYQGARIYLAVVLMNKDELAETDSLLRLVERPGTQLSASEYPTVKWMRALLNGDTPASVRAFEDLAAAAQSQGEIAQLANRYADELNLPRKGLATMKRVDPHSAEMVDQTAYWWDLTDMYDVLGEHDRQLAAARKGHAQFPALLSMLELEAVALAALGRAQQAEELVQTSVDLPPEASTSPGAVAADVSLELRAQGDTAAANRMSAWGVHWYESVLANQQGANRSDYADALYAAERWRESWNVRQDICHANLDPGHVVDGSAPEVECLGWAGVLAARLQQRDSALAIDNRLANVRYRFLPQEGLAMQWRARIAAVLGDPDKATRLLHRAFEEAGINYSSYWRRHPDFLLLRDFKPYQELMRPKG